MAPDRSNSLCVHHRFEAQVEATPEATAVVCGDRRLTYRELNQQANQLAHYLQEKGVKPETLVGVYLNRSIEMVVGIFAILKAGGGYLPLDRAYPKERLLFTIEDSETTLVLTDDRLADELPLLKITPIYLDPSWQAYRSYPDGNPVVNVTANNIIYMTYTSGSTGKPKGVIIEHRSVLALIDWGLQDYTREELSGVLASTSICFDLSVYELFVTLSCGAKIIVVENALHLPTAPAANEVTLVNSVPSVVSNLLKSSDLPPSVRTVNLCGEPLLNHLVQRIYRQNPNVDRVVNLYGPSEDTVYSTIAIAQKGSDGDPPIGKPIPGTQAYILDDNLQPVPDGEPGELYLAGAGLARGYHNRPEITAQRFIKDPFANNSNARMYKTGDRVFRLETGDIQFVGRVDNQVKIRGFRMELGEVETVLCEHPAVNAAIAIAREDEPGEKYLAAYILPNRGAVVTSLDLRSFLRQKLPYYMVPSAFVFLEALPLLPNGKANRKALVAMEPPQRDRDTEIIPPQTAIEQTLAQIWHQVLGIDEVGIADNFFELGGDSILAITIVAKANEAGLKVTAPQLFQHQTIAELASVVEPIDRDSIPASHSTIQTDTYPLSPLQQDIASLLAKNPQPGWFLCRLTCLLQGDVCVENLQAAWQAVADRHPILRSRFSWDDPSAAVQTVCETVNLPWEILDWREYSPEKQQSRWQALLDADWQFQFDFSVAPLMRFKLIRLQDKAYQFIWLYHQLLLDGWSESLVLKEAFNIYDARCQERKLRLEMAPPYSDYIAWLQRQDCDRAVQFWQAELAGFSTPTPLGFDRAVLESDNYDYDRKTASLSDIDTATLRSLCRQHHFTLNTIVQGAWAILLSQISGKDDILFGTTVTNRPGELVGVDRIAGVAISDIPVRVQIPSQTAIVDWLKSLQSHHLQLRQYDYLPVTVRYPDWCEVPETSPLFDSLLVFENLPMVSSLPDWCDTLEIDSVEYFERVNYPLMLQAFPEKELKLDLMYDRRAFSDDRIEEILDRLQRILEAIASNSSGLVSGLK